MLINKIKFLIIKLLKLILFMLVLLVIFLFLGYLGKVYGTSCYNLSLEEGIISAESIIENKINGGSNDVFGANLNNRLLVSYSKIIIDEKEKESFIDLYYIDKKTKQEFSITIFENCDIHWSDGHSNAYEKHKIQ